MPKTKKTLTIAVKNLHGDQISTLDLPPQVFDLPLIPALLSQAVRVFRQNQTTNQRVVKTRADVKASTRKIYRQKGTGRARHGDIKAPIFVGGGKAHGAKGYLIRLSLPKKMKAKVLSMVLSYLYKNNHLNVIDHWTQFKNTKSLLNTLTPFQLDTSKRPLLIYHHQKDQTNLWQVGKNVPYLHIKSTADLSFMDLLLSDYVLISQSALSTLIKRGGYHGS